MSNDGPHLILVRPVHGDLGPLGIKVFQGTVNATYQMRDGKLWKEIGSIFVYETGRISVGHAADATPPEIAVLTGHAEEVWRGEVVPTEATGWFFKRRPGRPSYWCANISVPADTMRDQTAAEIAALRSSSTLSQLRHQSARDVVEFAEQAA